MSTATSTPTGTGKQPGGRLASHKHSQPSKRGRVQQRWLYAQRRQSHRHAEQRNGRCDSVRKF